MKFTLSAPERSHGIRVIGSIPDLPLCRVEGVNGIGKTLALHLLELCSGHQPYRTRPHAWRTLCQYLGPAEVTVEGLFERSDPDQLGDPHSMRFAFDWSERAEEPVPLEITHTLFDQITLDDRPMADMDEVRSWLTVVRIAGDETLTETIAGLVSQDRELLRAASRVARARSERADLVFSEMLSAFPVEPARRALDIAAEMGTLTRRRAELEQRRDEQRGRLELLERAQAAYSAVANVTANAETLRAEIDSLREQFESAQARSRHSEEEVAAARERERLSAEAAKSLASAQRTFTRRLNAVKRIDEEIEAAAAKLGIAAEPAAIAAALAEVEQERSRAARDRADLADLFALRDLLENLVQTLAPAAAGGLRARTVGTIGEQAITAGDLLDAVRRRRSRLMTDAPAVEELDRRLSEMDERNGELRTLSDLLAEGEEKRSKLADAEEVLEDLGKQGEDAEESLAEKVAAHAAAQRVEIEVGSALGATERQLSQLGGGLSLEDLQADLERRLGDAGTTKATLQADLRAARGRLVSVDDELDAADTRRDELESLSAELRRDMAEQARALRAEERHARLRALLGDRAPNPDHGGEDLARAWIAVHEAEGRAVRRLQGARGGLDALAAAMNDLVEVIRHDKHPSPGLDPIRRLYQDRMRDRLSEPGLLKALFDDGELTRVDLAAREVRWRTAAGKPRVRPFEAFSSGERAFAYVQARLAGVGELTARNRVVAVDEFGAFLSRDRLIRLQEVIQRQLDENLVHQAIVVLPLTRLDAAAEEGADGEPLAPGYVTGTFDALATA